MKTIQLKNNNSFVLIIWLLPFLASLFLLQQNILRSLFIISTLIAWLVIYLKVREKTLFSLFFILIIGAFNVTFTPIISNICYKNGVFVNYLCPTFHIIDIFIFLSLIASLAKYIFNGFHFIKEKLKVFIPLLLFLIFYIVFHNNANEIINGLRSWFIVILVLLNKDKLVHLEKYINKEVLIGVASILSFQLIIAIFQFVLGRDLGLQLLGESNLLSGSINSSFISLSMREFLRGYGTFPHPNVLAGFALGISFLTLKLYNKKDLYIVSILLLSLTISIISFSRLHILLNIIVVIYYSLKETRNMTFNFFPLLFERFNSLDINSTSVVERLRLLKEGFRIFKENWLSGTGGGEFVRFLSNDVRTVSNISLFQPVHNSMLLLLIEYGIFGFITFVSYLILIFRIRKKNILDTIVSIFLILSISMFDHYLVSLPQGIIVLMMLLI